MKKSFKSFLAIFLAFVMLFGGAPAGALAALPDAICGLTASAEDQFHVLDSGHVSVTDVSLNVNDLPLETGDTYQLVANVSPEDATNKSVLWNSTNTDVATVDENGVVTAVSPGTATIIVISLSEGMTDKCIVTVTAAWLYYIELQELPYKTTYFVGDFLDPTGLTIKAVYSNGITQTLTSGFTCSPTQFNSSGTKEVTVSYENMTCPFYVYVEDVTLTQIEVLSLPNNLQYYVGENLDTTGLTLTAKYNNGTTQTVTGGFSCSPTVFDTAGTQTVTVTYGIKTCTFDVTVLEPFLTNISVKTQPDKLQYFVGETLDTAGLTLTATYNTGTEETITSGFTCSPMLLDTAGSRTITVTYNGMTCTFDVDVQSVILDSLSVKTMPGKTIYDVGDTLDTTGLSLTAIYSNGTVQTITSGFTCLPTVLETAGTRTISVNYGGKTCSFTVTVRRIEAERFTIASIADMTYTGSAITPTVNVKFNGMPLTINVDYTVTYTNYINAGTATVTITGIGNFTGTKQVNYTINKAHVDSFYIEPIPNYIYTGREITPTVRAYFNGNLMTLNIDYKVMYNNNKYLGTAIVHIVGIGNFKGTKSVTFEILPIPVESISLNYQVLNLRYRQSRNLSVVFNPGNATIKSVIWSTSDATVATVSADGRVTAKGVGTAVITATSVDGGHTASCTVTVKTVWWQWLIKILLFGWIWYCRLSLYRE